MRFLLFRMILGGLLVIACAQNARAQASGQPLSPGGDEAPWRKSMEERLEQASGEMIASLGRLLIRNQAQLGLCQEEKQRLWQENAKLKTPSSGMPLPHNPGVPAPPQPQSE
jgi:hypothetical protein